METLKTSYLIVFGLLPILLAGCQSQHTLTDSGTMISPECELPVGAKFADFVVICDSGNVARNRYNVRQSGRYFIIGPYGKIVAKGNIRNMDNLRVKLDQLIDEYIQFQTSFESD